MFFSLTVIDEADRRAEAGTVTRFSSFDFLKSVGQTIEEVLLLLGEAQPQIELQLSLYCPACRTKSLLPRQLANANYDRRRNDTAFPLNRRKTLNTQKVIFVFAASSALPSGRPP